MPDEMLTLTAYRQSGLHRLGR